MFHRKSLAAFAVILLVAVAPARAQAPLTINGVADRGEYVDTVTLRIATTNGYTYAAKLDGVSIPVDANVVVTNLDYHQLILARTNIASTAVTNRVIGFIVRGSIYGTTERGYPMRAQQNRR